MDEATAAQKAAADARIAKRFFYVDPSTLQDPQRPGGDYRVFKDHFWLANDEGHIGFYALGAQVLGGPGISALGNPTRRISEMVLPRTPGATQIIQIPWVFVPTYYSSEDY